MKYSFLTLCLLLTIGLAPAQETKKLTAEKHNEYGLIYSLPVTHLDIEIVATKTTHKAGPYHQYAEKYLGLSNAITQDSETWEITSIRAIPYGVPNPEAKYLMQFKPENNGYIFVDERGLLLSINTEPVVDTIPEPQTIQRENTPLDNNSFANYLTEEILMASSEAKRAEMVAKLLYRTRESKMNLITGETDEELPTDGEAYKVLIQELDKQAAALTAAFMGTTQTETIIRHIDYTPQEEVADEVLFRISDHYGIVNADDLSGSPIYITLNITEEGALPTNPKGETKKMPKNAIAYTIPGEAEIIISDGKQTLHQELVPVSQFGIVFGLDPLLFTNKKNPSCVTFFPHTGAIRKIGE